MADDDIPEIDIKARQREGVAHVEVEVPIQQKADKGQDSQPTPEDKKDEQSDKSDEKEEGSGFTIAGYTPGEILKAPLTPPDEEEVGKRSPQSE